MSPEARWPGRRHLCSALCRVQVTSEEPGLTPHWPTRPAPASAELQQVTTTQQLPPDLSERHKAWAAVKCGNTQIVVVINIELKG